MNKLFMVMLLVLFAVGFQLAAQQDGSSGGGVQLVQQMDASQPIISTEGLILGGVAGLPLKGGIPNRSIAHQIPQGVMAYDLVGLSLSERLFIARGHRNNKVLARLAAHVERKARFHKRE